MLRTIIGVIALIADAWSMNREYKDGNLIGVLLWESCCSVLWWLWYEKEDGYE